MTERKSQVVSITMSEAMKALMNAMAAKAGCTRSQYIRKLLAEELERIGLLELEAVNGVEQPEDKNDYEVNNEDA
jgi:predicted DNA-binding protein